MSRQRLSIDVATHVRLGAPLLLMPPVAALIYPFLLEGFHARDARLSASTAAFPTLSPRNG